MRVLQLGAATASNKRGSNDRKRSKVGKDQQDDNGGVAVTKNPASTPLTQPLLKLAPLSQSSTKKPQYTIQNPYKKKIAALKPTTQQQEATPTNDFKDNVQLNQSRYHKHPIV